MSEWKAKRFWKQARVVKCNDSFGIELDGRPVRTPGKARLEVPTSAMAQALAVEWDAQEGVINPESMPMTRAANSALEKVAPQMGAVVEMLALYGDADLTCYRASSPEELVRRQADAWDPLLDWAAQTYRTRLIPVQGVIHHPQNEKSLRNLAVSLHAMSAFQLTGFHDLVSLSGSLVIGLAAIEKHFSPDDLWTRSRIDEDWQQDQWGKDDEAMRMAEAKRQAFLNGFDFYQLSTINS